MHKFQDILSDYSASNGHSHITRCGDD